MYLLACICATLSWFFVAAASIHSLAIRRFYASGARVVLLMSTKLVCKVATIVALVAWRDAQPSTYCKWYLPVDGAVLLWQAYVAPVGAVGQAMIAAADAACTFCCCWLLSDRWPYDISTGTVLAFNLLLAGVSLWLAERIEQSDRREYESAWARGTGAVAAVAAATAAATAAADEVVAMTAQEEIDACQGKAAQTLEHEGLSPFQAASGATGEIGCEDADGPAGEIAALIGGGSSSGGGGGGGSGSRSRSSNGINGLNWKGSSRQSNRVLASPASALDFTPVIPHSLLPPTQRQRPLQHLQQLQQAREGRYSVDACYCHARRPLTCASSDSAGGATAAGARGSCPCVSNARISGGGAGGGTSCSEVSSPATLSTTRSISRVLPSFSTISNCSVLGGCGCGCSTCTTALTETGGSSGAASRPSSCAATHLNARAAGQPQQQQSLVPGRVLSEAMAAAAAAGLAPSLCGAGGGLHGPALCAAKLPSCTAAGRPAPVASASTSESANVSATPASATEAQSLDANGLPPPPATQVQDTEDSGELRKDGPSAASKPQSAGLDGTRSIEVLSVPAVSGEGALLLPQTVDALPSWGMERRESANGSPISGRSSSACAPAPASGSGAAAATTAAPAACSLDRDATGSNPLRHLRRLVQTLVARSGSIAVAAAAATAAVAPRPARHPSSARTTDSRGTSVSGTASSSCAPSSYSSSISRCSEPRLCSYQSQDGGSTGEPSALHGRGSAQKRRPAPSVGSSVGAARAQYRRCCDPASISSGDGSSGSHVVEARPTSMAVQAGASKRCVNSTLVGPIISQELVSADCVLVHPQQPSLLSDALLHLQELRQQPAATTDLQFSALSPDAFSPVLQEQRTPTTATAAATGALPVCIGPREGALASVPVTEPAVAGGKATAAPPATAASQALPIAAALSTAWYGTGESGDVSGAADPGHGYSQPRAMHGAALDDSRIPRCFAVAKALVRRGGCNAVYDMPALHHSRCSVKLPGLSVAELPYGFAERVASLLAAASGAAVAHPAALAAVGVYVRQGCVEVVADVLVPSAAAVTEGAIVGVVANAAAHSRGDASEVGAAAPDALSHLLALAESATAAPGMPPTQQVPVEAAASQQVDRVDRAVAEAMLGALERSLLPQIQSALPLQPPSAASLPVHGRGWVGLHATVGAVQVETWHTPQLAAATPPTPPPPPPPPRRPPPPTIVCVTPCCVALSQPGGDDTRDRRRQTLTLTVALAGVAHDGGDAAPLPRIFVRHSGRCLAVLVRRCAVRYAGCLTATVEVAMSGIRPGLLFLEAAAPGGNGRVEHHPHAQVRGHSPLSIAWPVLVVGAARVAAEVMNMQPQLDATALLRAVQADAELLNFYQQGNDSNAQTQQQEQRQKQDMDGGVTGLLLDFGIWLDAVSVPDTAVIAAVFGGSVGGDAGAAAAAAAARMAPPLPPSPQPSMPSSPVTALAGARAVVDEDKDDDEYDKRGSSDDSSWESSDERLWSAAHGPGNHGTVGSAGRASHTPSVKDGVDCGGGGVDCDGGGGGGAPEATDSDGEVQMLLLRGLQPDQELLEGSLDCAVEYEQRCRQSSALQSAAAGLGLRLLRFAVLRGWPAAATLFLKGLMGHCRLSFAEVRMLFPAAAAGGGGGGMPLLHTAVMSGSLTMVRAVKAWAQRYRCALPWDESVAAAGGLTALHLAAVQEGGRLAGAILGLWTDAEALWAVVRDRDGRSPQEYACMRALSGSLTPAPAAASSAVLAAAGLPKPPAAPHAAAGVTAVTLQGGQRQNGRQQQQQPALGELLRPFGPRDWLVGQEYEAGLPSLQSWQQQQQEQQAAMGGATAVADQPVAVSVARAAAVPAAAEQQRHRQAREPEGWHGSGSDVPTAVDRGEGPGSGSSIAFMTPGLNFAVNAMGRFDRTSDCGSMSAGPDSQWSHSTNATALTQTLCYRQQATGRSLDTRGGQSPVNPVSARDALNAAVLSLANLPDVANCSSSSGGASCGVTATTAAAAARVTAVLGGAGSSSSNSELLLPTLFALTAAQQKQTQLPPPQYEVARDASPLFELEQLAQKPASTLSHQLQQQLALLHPQTQPRKPCHPHLALHTPPSSPQPQQQQQLGPGQHGAQPEECVPLAPPPAGAAAASGRGVDVAAAGVGCRSDDGAECVDGVLSGERSAGHTRAGRASELDFPASSGSPGAKSWSQPSGWRTLAVVQARLVDDAAAEAAGTRRYGGGAVILAGAAAARESASLAAAAGSTGGGGAGTRDDALRATAAVRVVLELHAVAAAKPPPPLQQQPLPHRTAAAAPPPPAPPRPTGRGLRLLATSLLPDGRTSAASCTHSTLGSTGSPSYGTVCGASSTGTSASMMSTAGSALSTQSNRRGCAAGDRFLSTPRRVAFADEYAPACAPTIAARMSCLMRILPLLAARRAGVKAETDKAGSPVLQLSASELAAAPGGGAQTAATIGVAGGNGDGNGVVLEAKGARPDSQSDPTRAAAATAYSAAAAADVQQSDSDAVLAAAALAPQPPCGQRPQADEWLAPLPPPRPEAAVGPAAKDVVLARPTAGPRATAIAAGKLLPLPRLLVPLWLLLAGALVLVAALVVPVAVWTPGCGAVGGRGIS